MLIEILNYREFISEQLRGCALILRKLYIVPKPFGVRAAGCKFLFEKVSFAFLTDSVNWFLTSLKHCKSQELFEASAECFCAGQGQSSLE
jgi:hypothetical protein